MLTLIILWTARRRSIDSFEFAIYTKKHFLTNSLQYDSRAIELQIIREISANHLSLERYEDFKYEWRYLLRLLLAYSRRWMKWQWSADKEWTWRAKRTSELWTHRRARRRRHRSERRLKVGCNSISSSTRDVSSANTARTHNPKVLAVNRRQRHRTTSTLTALPSLSKYSATSSKSRPTDSIKWTIPLGFMSLCLLHSGLLSRNFKFQCL